jgi:hypothetical protein
MKRSSFSGIGRSCGVMQERPNNSFKPNPLRGSAVSGVRPQEVLRVSEDL